MAVNRFEVAPLIETLGRDVPLGRGLNRGSDEVIVKTRVRIIQQELAGAADVLWRQLVPVGHQRVQLRDHPSEGLDRFSVTFG